MNPFSAIRAIAFDLDGTLVDSLPGLARALDQALATLKLPGAGTKRVAHWIGDGADLLTQRALTWALAQPAGTSAPHLTAPHLAGQPFIRHRSTSHDLANAPPDPRLPALRQLFDSHYQTCAPDDNRLFDGVADTLNQLQQRGFPLALVTNKPTKFIAPLLQSLGIARHFHPILGGDDVPRKKPHPAALYLVLGTLGLLPSQLLFIGDSRNDIKAAKAARCPCIGVSYGYNYGDAINQSQPDAVLDHLADLLTLLPRHLSQETTP